MSKKVLLIEDNKAVRENIEEILTLSGYDVATAENGKKGVELAQKNLPDLVICDIMMPELDGYGVLHLLSKSAQTSSIPFIFLTAKADRADFRKGMEMGADDYITKPFDDIELLNAVEIRLRKSELMKQEFSSNAKGLNDFLNQARITAKVDLTEGDRELQVVKKKQLLYAQSHRPTYLYFVSSGKIKTYKVNDDGKELITAIYTEGDFFGYSPLLEETLYMDNAEALEDAEVMLIPKSDFLALISKDSQVAAKFIKLLSKNLAEKEDQLINLAYNSLRKRVANGLLHVYDKYKTEPSDKPKLEVAREDLAQVVGTATESLIRTLSDFKHEHLIEVKEGKIVILNESKLRTLLN
jgi:CRP/FNR family cyclic AMP-dependent transcriptional regulator